MSLAAAAAARGPGAVWSPTHVQVTVLQARGLRAKGPGGTSDAYAVIQVGKEKYATSVSERSLGAPVWREEATFELPPLLSDGAAATLQLTVLHRALLGLDKFLGRAEVDLRELHRAQGRRRTQWFPLKSKPGKKEKDRGEIEVDVQFMRNNMTASMFDLSMKDKSRNPFGKLKDKIKGKSKDSASDTSSAIVPGSLASGDSDDESALKDKKKKSKIKTLFSKSALQKTPLSQSMSVLPTSKSDRVLLRPGDFQSRWGDDEEEDNEDQPSTASDVPSPRRAAAAEPRPLSQVSLSLPRKDGLSFLGGLRAKNDLLSRSNVCINGNHVYAEPPEAKDSSPSSSPSPQSARKRQLFSSMENLVASPEPPAARAPARDPRESPPPAHSETGREAKETKKQEGKKSSLLSLVTGKKDVARAGEGDSPPAAPRREKEPRPAETGAAETRGKLAEDGTAGVPEKAPASNPFEEVHIADPEAGPESTPKPTVPVPAPRAPQTKAVKPRREASPEPLPAAAPPPRPASPLRVSALSAPAESLPACPLPSSSSPTAAPLATSTPVEHWPPAGPAGAQQSTLLPPAGVQQPRAPSPASPAEPPGAEQGGLGAPLAAGQDRKVSREHSEEPLPWEAGRHEARGLPPRARPRQVPSLAGVPEPLTPDGGHGEPSGEDSPDSEGQPGAFADRGRTPATASAGAPPLPTGDPSEGGRKAKKRVSFSEWPITEGEEGQGPSPGGEDSQEPTLAGGERSAEPGLSPGEAPSEGGPGTQSRTGAREVGPDSSLPSIPEVASDDERVDPPEGDGGTRRAGGVVTTPDADAGPGPRGGGEAVEVPGCPRGVAPVPPVAGPRSPETCPAAPPFPRSPHSDTPRLSTAESQKKATAEGKAEPSSKRKPLLQARVSPSEAAEHRPHPVKPMNTTATKIANSSLGTATVISEKLINEALMKKYNPSDPAFAYAQLTHDELIQLVLKQKEAISKKEFQVRELEDYIDNLLVRVMEETPNILRVPAQVGKKAGKM